VFETTGRPVATSPEVVCVAAPERGVPASRSQARTRANGAAFSDLSRDAAGWRKDHLGRGEPIV
jgi:hypothetical protein